MPAGLDRAVEHNRFAARLHDLAIEVDVAALIFASKAALHNSRNRKPLEGVGSAVQGNIKLRSVMTNDDYHKMLNVTLRGDQ